MERAIHPFEEPEDQDRQEFLDNVQTFRNLHRDSGDWTDIVDANGVGGSTPVAFSPTRHELFVIVGYWARVMCELQVSLTLGIVDYHAAAEFWSAQARLDCASDVLGKDVVRHAYETVIEDFRRRKAITLRDWDIIWHGSEGERTRLREAWSEHARIWTQEEVQLANWEDEQERHRQTVEKDQWATSHQADRERERQQWQARFEAAEQDAEGAPNTDS
jgi:hypothetical protein